jgi:hypothetical protein
MTEEDNDIVIENSDAYPLELAPRFEGKGLDRSKSAKIST